MNLSDLVAVGRFDPHLSPTKAAAEVEVTEAASSTPAAFVAHLRWLSPVDPFQGEDDYLDVVAAAWTDA